MLLNQVCLWSLHCHYCFTTVELSTALSFHQAQTDLLAAISVFHLMILTGICICIYVMYAYMVVSHGIFDTVFVFPKQNELRCIYIYIFLFFLRLFSITCNGNISTTDLVGGGKLFVVCS